MYSVHVYQVTLLPILSHDCHECSLASNWLTKLSDMVHGTHSFQDLRQLVHLDVLQPLRGRQLYQSIPAQDTMRIKPCEVRLAPLLADVRGQQLVHSPLLKGDCLERHLGVVQVTKSQQDASQGSLQHRSHSYLKTPGNMIENILSTQRPTSSSILNLFPS